MNGRTRRFILPGDQVQVRAWESIARTLDSRGMVDQLPFMPEMLKFCGHRFTVSKRIERTCEETQGGMRRMRNAVFLEDLRCDGSAHGGCQKGCRIFWKEAWLEEIHERGASFRKAAESRPTPSLPLGVQDGRYTCQSTELIRATSYLSFLDFGVYFRDIRARTYTPLRLGRILAYALYLRLRWLVARRSYRILEGRRASTPVEILALEPGEWVQVKTKEEIRATLDQNGKNHGLAFTVEMMRFCGGTFRVLRRLDKMIQEPTHKLIEVRNTVILEGVICDGCHILRGGCPRDNYHFWREIWLRRVQAPRNENAHLQGSKH